MIFIFLTIIVFAIYFPGISPSVFGGDSGDIILASWFGGVAHPPGYPLNTMLGWFFTHLPYFATVAYKSNLMMAFLQAVNIGILYLLLELLTKRKIIALASALIIAFNPLFWLYAHVTEVFQLQITLNSLAVYFLFLWREKSSLGKSNRPAKKYLNLSIMFLGLSIFYHHISILLLPAFYYLIRNTDKKLLEMRENIFKFILGLAIGIVPYFFIVYAAFQKTPVNWDNPASLNGLMRLILRADFGSFTPADFLIGQTIIDRFIQLKFLFVFLKSDFELVSLSLIIIGFFYLYSKTRALFWFTLIIICLTGPAFLIYASFPLSNDFLIGIWERFLLGCYYFLAIPLAFGLLFIFLFLKKQSKIFLSESAKRLVLLIFEFSFLLLPFSMLFINFPKTDLSNFTLGDFLGYDILYSTKPNSVVVILGDTMALNAQYIYWTIETFRDRKLIVGGLLRFPYYRQQIIRQYPQLAYSDFFKSNYSAEAASMIKDLVENNVNNFPIYTSGIEPEIQNSKWVPSGLLIELISKDARPEELANIFERFKLKEKPEVYQHFMADHILSTYQESFIKTANYLSENSKIETAIPLYQKAIDLYPENETAYADFTSSLIKHERCDETTKLLYIPFRMKNQTLSYLRNLALFEHLCNQDEETAKKIEAEIEKKFGGAKLN